MTRSKFLEPLETPAMTSLFDKRSMGATPIPFEFKFARKFELEGSLLRPRPLNASFNC